MLKGCQKRVIWVRSTDNKWFDEAYFILSDAGTNTKRPPSEGEMLREANKIIAASPFSGYYGLSESKINKKRPSSRGRLLWFALGVILTAVCVAVSRLLL